MWANAQRDGRPALPNIGGALCSMPQSLADTLLLCSKAAKTRRLLKFGGVPHTGQPISAVSRPKFTILWRHVEDILLFNKFFAIVDMCLRSLRRYSPTKLCDGSQMAIFGDFFASCVFSELRAAGFRPAS